MLFPKGQPLTYLLQHSAQWRVRYEDNAAMLFERTPAVVNERSTQARSFTMTR